MVAAIVFMGINILNHQNGKGTLAGGPFLGALKFGALK
jgi:hypothetical protein